MRHHRICCCSRLGSTDGIGYSDIPQDVGSFYGIALTLSGNINSGYCAADVRYDLRYPEQAKVVFVLVHNAAGCLTNVYGLMMRSIDSYLDRCQKVA